jgi:predicted DNA-binding protein (MmcQ/YjbR family)
LAEALRSQHAAVRAGYHLNKRHWNTVRLTVRSVTMRSRT